MNKLLVILAILILFIGVQATLAKDETCQLTVTRDETGKIAQIIPSGCAADVGGAISTLVIDNNPFNGLTGVCPAQLQQETTPQYIDGWRPDDANFQEGVQVGVLAQVDGYYLVTINWPLVDHSYFFVEAKPSVIEFNDKLPPCYTMPTFKNLLDMSLALGLPKTDN